MKYLPGSAFLADLAPPKNRYFNEKSEFKSRYSVSNS